MLYLSQDTIIFLEFSEKKDLRFRIPMVELKVLFIVVSVS